MKQNPSGNWLVEFRLYWNTLKVLQPAEFKVSYKYAPKYMQQLNICCQKWVDASAVAKAAKAQVCLRFCCCLEYLSYGISISSRQWLHSVEVVLPWLSLESLSCQTELKSNWAKSRKQLWLSNGSTQLWLDFYGLKLAQVNDCIWFWKSYLYHIWLDSLGYL